MQNSNKHKYGEFIMMLFVFVMAYFTIPIYFGLDTLNLPFRIAVIFIGTLYAILLFSKSARNFWDKYFINGNALEKIKNYHTRICIAILMLSSFITFILGLRGENITQTVPWWFGVLYGWSGLVIVYKIYKIEYEDKK